MNLLLGLLSQYPQGMREAYDSLKEAVEKMLRQNAFSVVCLDTIFTNNDEQEEISSLCAGTLEISDGLDNEEMVGNIY